MKLPFADEVNYWKTSKRSCDTLLDNASKLIVEVGGYVTGRAMGMSMGNSAVMIVFEIDGEQFRIVWPVLTTALGERDTPAARTQAATFVYHDVKAKCMAAKILGARLAFFSNLLLDGVPVAEMAAPQLMASMPKLLENRA